MSNDTNDTPERNRELQPHFIQVPRQLLFDDDIQPTDKLTYGAIYWFSQFKDRVCKASNGTLAEAVNISPKTVRNCLTRLEKKGYIKRKYDSKAKQNRIAIVPMVTVHHRGVSSDEDGGVPNQGQGVSPDNEQRDNSPKGISKRDNKKTMQKKHFEAFWDEYPRKVGKQNARRKFLKIERDKFDTIMAALREQKDTTQWQKDDGQYVPYPTTWINQGRWEDDPEAYNYEEDDKETGVAVKSY